MLSNYNYFVLFALGLINVTFGGKVIEMDDRLVEFSTQGKWLVSFYAPWCGHCRKLEPVMEEVAKQFNEKSAIAIAKIDATRFQNAANHFEVKAYPTIKFISGKKMINYSGERRKSDIIEFLSRVDSPRVTKILNQIDFDHSKTKHKHFFLLVSSSRHDQTRLVREFYELANLHYLDAYFLHASPEHMPKEVITAANNPLVRVFKEGEFFDYDESGGAYTLENFVKNESFLMFTEITMSNFHNLVETKKTLIILNLNCEDKSKERQTKKLIKVYDAFSKANRELNHKDFQFGYVDNSDLLSSIAIWTLPTPQLFIFNTSSYTYSFAELVDTSTKNNLLLDLDIQDLLDQVKLGKIEFYGGQSYFRTLRRPLWELYRAVIEMFFEAPFLSLLIFGFPFGVISIVFYFLCCVDSNDQMDEDYMSNSENESDVNEEDYYLEEEPTKMSEQEKKTQ